MTTPFELSLESDLDIERQRFANEWLFKWHGMTYEGGVTDVEDFRGGRIRYSGIRFGYQQQQIFWQAIERYLIQKAHEAFKRWDAETAIYPTKVRQNSIDGTEQSLRRFVHSIARQGVDTDRRLRGRGFPENVPEYNPARTIVLGEAEITQLANAHRCLLAEPQRFKILARHRTWLEDFYASNKGLIWLGGLLVSGLIAATGYFVRWR